MQTVQEKLSFEVMITKLKKKEKKEKKLTLK
jgi:hypothetical protein